MTKEFNLSEKITYDLYKKGFEDCEKVEGLDVKDVKEFIRRLKEAITHEDGTPCLSVKEIIDKLAGDGLK